MRKIIFTLSMIIAVTITTVAQSPQAFKYQAVARDNVGNIISSQPVSIRTSILLDSISGTVAYSETHSITTNQFGLIVIEIGRGAIESGVFEDISWGRFSHFLKVELDETGGTNYQLMGTPKLLSVPFALNSRSLTLSSPNGVHYEVTVDDYGNLVTSCFPQPSVADAGPDQDSICIPATLSANIPQIGTGAWSIVSGIGGSFADSSDASSEFSGIAGNAYILRWTITNVCDNNYDDVSISFKATPPVADSGPDKLYVTSPTTLSANDPGNGTGTWLILSGTGGNIADPNNPSSTFSGVVDSSYTLRWTITTICDTTYDDLIISFNLTGCPPSVADTDGNTYTTVYIGTQCWMAENLNIGNMINGNIDQDNNGIIEKYCYDNSTTNCDMFGGLYQWDEMMQYTTIEGAQGICPVGWHIPADAEWCTLENELDPTITCYLFDYGWRGVDGGGSLKDTTITHWTTPNTGATNISGFTALPGGFLENIFDNFEELTYRAAFWTSTEYDWLSSKSRGLGYDTPQVLRDIDSNNIGFSVRCLRD